MRATLPALDPSKLFANNQKVKTGWLDDGS